MTVASASRSTCQSTRNTSVASALPRRYMGPMLRSWACCRGECVTYALGCEDLLGTGQVSQACRAVDGVAETVAVNFNDFATFNTHLHLHRGAVAAGIHGLVLQTFLDGHAGGECIAFTGEHDEKAVAQVVGVAGFELATPCTPCKCATRLRYTPTSLAL
jgi:hypothetical protein